MPNDDLDTTYYTLKEVAAKFGVTYQTVYKWVREKKLDSIRTPGGRHRVTKRQLVDFATKEYGSSHD